jgi:Ca-activated chloride channel homolog
MGVLFFSAIRMRKKSMRQLGEMHKLSGLFQGPSPLARTTFIILFLVAFTLVVLGAANLQRPDKNATISRKGVDVMLVWDVSRSMLATDIRPNRLERSRIFMMQMLERLHENRVGLVVFAGRAYLQMPLTSDIGAARMYLQSAGVESVPTQGTVISEALKMAASAFPPKQKKFKSIILITDGEDHEESTLQMVKELVEQGIIIHVVGVGTTQGSTLPGGLSGEPKRDLKGNVVVSKLNERVLQEIAQAGQGIYYNLSGSTPVANKMAEQLNSMEKTTISDIRSMQFISYFPWFLGLAFFLLLFEILWPVIQSYKK